MQEVLFFTRGISLQTWDEVGSLGREIAIYQRLTEKGVGVSFITYGGARDLEYESQLGEIKILCNKWNLPMHWYERLMPVLHARTLFAADLFKSNQINGADVALRFAKIFRKPLIARCGYMWSEFARQADDQYQMETAHRIEKQVFGEAERVVVTTPAMKAYIIDHYPDVPENLIRVFPNYVLTDVFTPGEEEPEPNRICYVGRLHEQKNLMALLQACEGLEVELHLVGEGHLRADLQEQAALLDVRIVLYGNLPHSELPAIIRQAAIFALVSHYEGHPKALLEAMACGVPVLAANSPGVREQITHAETGWLVETDSRSIRHGIQHLLSSPQLRDSIGKNARNVVVENFSIEKILEQEYSLLTQIAGDSH